MARSWRLGSVAPWLLGTSLLALGCEELLGATDVPELAEAHAPDPKEGADAGSDARVGDGGSELLPGSPSVLASGQESPGDLAATGAGVYWTSGGRIMRSDGTSAPTPAVADAGQVRSVAADESTATIVWTTVGGIGWVKNTGEVTFTPTPSCTTCPGDVAGHGGYLYLVNYDMGQACALNAASCAVGGVIFHASPKEITADDVGLSFLAPFDGGTALFECQGGWGGHLGCPSTNGNFDGPPSVTGLVSPKGLLTDTAARYWFDAAEEKIYRAAARSSSPASIPAEGKPTALAIDGKRVYWATSDGTVRTAPKEGGASSVLATGQKTPTSMVVADGSLYWTNAGDGTVMKLRLR